MRLINNLKQANTSLLKNNRPAIDEELAGDPLADLHKKRDFQREMYIKFLKRFIDEKCTYDFQRLTFHEDVKKAYAKFLDDNKEEISKYNVNYALTVSDIAKLDSRYEYKILTVCKFCKKKQFTNCCLDYVNKSDRTKHVYMVNLALTS